MNFSEWLTSIPFLLASLLSIGFQRRVGLRGGIRTLGVVACFLSVLIAWLAPTPLLLEDGARVSTLLTISYVAISGVVFAVVPYRVLAAADVSLLFFIQAFCLGMFRVSSVVSFVAVVLLTNGLVSWLIVRETKRSSGDPRTRERNHAYFVFRLIAIVLLCLFTLSQGRSNFLYGVISSPPSTEIGYFAAACLIISLFSFLGLFPFHSWFPLFLGAPRLNLFIPVTTISIGITFFLRFFSPIFPRIPHQLSFLVTIFAAIGLIYGALLLFGEHRLKRIVGYVVMSHIGLMVLVGTSAGEAAGSLPVQIDSINLLFAASGLTVVLTILASRFGLTGVTSASGLASAYPELGICFLVCALSLVGFPGTIGFVSEELLFQGGFAYRLQILPIIVGALALNGYSCFRLFARSFFGNPSFPDAAALPLATRERASLLIITAFILANGLLPDLMLKVFFWWI